MQAKRILLVTAGLMLTGFLFGGMAGAVLTFLLGLPDGWTGLPAWEYLVIGAGLGGLFGAVLGPLGAWLLMRHVPLGLAVGGTTLGTVLGGAAAVAWNAPGALVYGPVAGFALAALALRVHARRRLHRRGTSSHGRLTP
jgi:hypothetical protein